MADANLTFINAALTRTGSDPISSLSDGTVGAKITAQSYESLVKAELANHPWKRASKVEILNRLDPDSEGDPPEPWLAAYELPSDLVEIRSLRVSGSNISYEVFSGTLLCNANTGDDVVLQYIWRVPEVDWPPWFAEGITQRLEAMFLRGIGERYREAELREKSASDQFAKARNRDSQSQPPRNVVSSPTLMARGGFTPWNDWPPSNRPWRYG